MDITTVNHLICIRIDCSIWSARAKLRPEDLPDDIRASLPPGEVATIGSKRLFDADKLKIFGTLKARAAAVLDKKGVRFLGGWALHEDMLPGIARDLEAIAAQFKEEHTRFCADYVRGVAEWAANFPEWAHIIINAVPKLHDIQSKFNFSWQAFKIVPAEGYGVYTGNDLDESLSKFEQQVIRETAQVIAATYRDCFEGKASVTKKAFRPLHTLVEKLDGLSFIHAHVYGLAKVLREVVAVGEMNPLDPSITKAFLSAASTPQGVAAICNDYARNNSVDEVFIPLAAPPVAQVPNIELPSGWTPPTSVEQPRSEAPVLTAWGDDLSGLV